MLTRSVIGLWLVLFVHAVGANFSRGSKLKEYCLRETFNATCGENAVIVMDSARYGRMKLGRCLKRGYGFVGCAVDVLSFVDSRCSGRSNCSLRVADLISLGIYSCPDEFSSYFEASYSCVKATPPSKLPSTCIKGSSITELSEFTPTFEVHHDSQTACPWTVVAAPGQKINVSLFDFNRHENRGHGGLLCHRIAVIREEGTDRETSVCNTRERIRNIYLSDNHRLQIEPISSNHRKRAGGQYYLFKYQALGCATPSMPYPFHTKRVKDTLEITCNVTRETWRQTCTDNLWHGHIGNCSDAATAPSTWGIMSHGWTSPFGLLVVIGSGVVLGVLFGVLLLSATIYIMKRKSKAGNNSAHDHVVEGFYQEPRDVNIDELRMHEGQTLRHTNYTEDGWNHPRSVHDNTLLASDKPPSSGYQTMSIASGTGTGSLYTRTTAPRIFQYRDIGTPNNLKRAKFDPLVKNL